MYGGILVEPVGGLSPVEKEFYVVQSEFYTKPGKKGDTLAFSFENGLAEHPSHVVFNGSAGSLVKNPLMAKVGDTIRMFYINAGPNLTANWHVIARYLTGCTPGFLDHASVAERPNPRGACGWHFHGRV